MRSTFCDKLEDLYEFKVQCIKNQCEDCGDLHKFSEIMQVENINESTPISWMRYEYVTYQNKTRDESRKIVLKESELCYDEFMTKFHPLIHPHIQHCHGARCQAKQFRNSKNCFPIGCILLVVDFSKNYTFASRTELQGKYYYSEQVAICVQVTYRHAQFEVN